MTGSKYTIIRFHTNITLLKRWENSWVSWIPKKMEDCNVVKRANSSRTMVSCTHKQVSGRAERQKWDDFSGSSKFTMVCVCQSFVGHWVTGKVSSGGGWLPWTWIVACDPHAVKTRERCTHAFWACVKLPAGRHLSNAIHGYLSRSHESRLQLKFHFSCIIFW